MRGLLIGVMLFFFGLMIVVWIASIHADPKMIVVPEGEMSMPLPPPKTAPKNSLGTESGSNAFLSLGCTPLPSGAVRHPLLASLHPQKLPDRRARKSATTGNNRLEGTK